MTASVYPMLFTFRDLIIGNGFAAGVTAQGRGLMVQEEDGWWFYGVEPGGMADKGGTPQEAHTNFRLSFRKILLDFVEDAKDINEFKRRIDQFFRTIDKEDEARWHEAAEKIRRGAPVGEPFDKLPRKRMETCCSVIVEQLDKPKKQFKPEDNILDTYSLPAAA